MNRYKSVKTGKKNLKVAFVNPVTQQVDHYINFETQKEVDDFAQECWHNVGTIEIVDVYALVAEDEIAIVQTKAGRRGACCKIEGEGRALTWAKMWAKVTDQHGTPATGVLITLDGERHNIRFTATGWGRVDGTRINLG